MYMPLIANIFILPLINQFLTTEDYAIYGLTYGYIGLLAGFGDLGLLELLQNSYYKERENYKSIWSQFIGFLHFYRVLYGIVLMIVIYYIFKDRIAGDSIYYYVLLVGIPVILFDFTKTIGIRLCQFENKHQNVYLATLISGILTISVTFVTIYVYHLGFVGWFISSFVARAFEFLYYGYYIYFIKGIKPDYSFNRAMVKAKVIIALPLIPKKYSNYLINNSDRAMLDLFRAQFGSVTLSQIGLYNIAYSFANYFASFNQAVNTVVTPIYFRLFARDDQREAGKTVVNLTLLWFTFSLGSGFLLSIWLKEILFYLYPKPEFHQAYKYSVLIIMALCYRPLYVAIIDKAIFKEKTKSSLKIVLTAGILNIILNCITIPLFGIQGAVLSSFVSYVFMGFGGFLFKEFRSYVDPELKPIRLLLILFLVSGMAFIFIEFSVLAKIGISMILVLIGIIWYLKIGKTIILHLNQLRLED